MDALELLLERTSSPRLQAPAPDNESLNNIVKAAIRVPDHAGLMPFRFIVCTGEGLNRLGLLFQEVAIKSGMSGSDIQRAIALPLRAPMVVIATGSR